MKENIDNIEGGKSLNWRKYIADCVLKKQKTKVHTYRKSYNIYLNT